MRRFQPWSTTIGIHPFPNCRLQRSCRWWAMRTLELLPQCHLCHRRTTPLRRRMLFWRVSRLSWRLGATMGAPRKTSLRCTNRAWTSFGQFSISPPVNQKQRTHLRGIEKLRDRRRPKQPVSAYLASPGCERRAARVLMPPLKWVALGPRRGSWGARRQTSGLEARHLCTAKMTRTCPLAIGTARTSECAPQARGWIIARARSCSGGETRRTDDVTATVLWNARAFAIETGRAHEAAAEREGVHEVAIETRSNATGKSPSSRNGSAIGTTGGIATESATQCAIVDVSRSTIGNDTVSGLRTAKKTSFQIVLLTAKEARTATGIRDAKGARTATVLLASKASPDARRVTLSAARGAARALADPTRDACAFLQNHRAAFGSVLSIVTQARDVCRRCSRSSSQLCPFRAASLPLEILHFPVSFRCPYSARVRASKNETNAHETTRRRDEAGLLPPEFPGFQPQGCQRPEESRCRLLPRGTRRCLDARLCSEALHVRRRAMHLRQKHAQLLGPHLERPVPFQPQMSKAIWTLWSVAKQRKDRRMGGSISEHRTKSAYSVRNQRLHANPVRPVSDRTALDNGPSIPCLLLCHLAPLQSAWRTWRQAARTIPQLPPTSPVVRSFCK